MQHISQFIESKYLPKGKEDCDPKREQPDSQDGFVLFLSPEIAKRIAEDFPRLLEEGLFLPARKGGDGKVEITLEPKR
jgi:hypothetical protein